MASDCEFHPAWIRRFFLALKPLMSINFSVWTQGTKCGAGEQSMMKAIRPVNRPPKLESWQKSPPLPPQCGGEFPPASTKARWLFPVAFHILLLLALFFGRWASSGNAQTVAVPFLSANYSYLDPFFSGLDPLAANVRALVIPGTMADLQNDPKYSTWNTNGGSGQAGLVWPAGMNTHDMRPDPQFPGDLILAAISAGMNVTASLSPPYGSYDGLTIDQVLATNLNPQISYNIQDVTVQITIQGGTFSGNTLNLKGKAAAGYSVSDAPPLGFPFGESKQVAGDVLLAINWGVDPSGTVNYFLADFQYQGSVATDDSNVLPVSAVLSDLGVSDPVDHWKTISALILNQLSTGGIHLQGAIPELLYLYDFSGSNTLSVDDSLGFTFSENYQAYEAIYPLINQYDAGITFSLPTRFTPPAPNSSGHTPGGNACGPTALSMALLAFQVKSAQPIQPADLVNTIYSNTMQFGFVSTNDFTNAFDWTRTKEWLDGKSYESIPFSSASPLPAGMRSYYITDTNSLRITGDWGLIDGVLTGHKQPVLLRTDLGFGSGTPPNPVGGGHVILLLGKGHSDLLGGLYGLSGDYYVVADPAGHFFANRNGVHYDRVQNLRKQAIGVNYGGWFAIYPLELLQSSILVKKTKLPVMRALTFPSPFNTKEIEGQCPVALLVTDPLGRQTGIQTNGVVFEDIPQSWFQPNVVDEEEDGDTMDLTNGVKTVVINNPSMGAYQVQLIGTGAGSYLLSSEDINSVGQSTATTNISGNIVLGKFVDFLFPSAFGLPVLQFARQDTMVTLSWPGAAIGFQLQSTTNLTMTNSWMPVTNSVGNYNGQNIVTNVVPTGAPRFFRLQK